jgi:hypothetical protein
MRAILIAFLIPIAFNLTFATKSSGQSLEVFGYMESEFDYQRINDSGFAMMYNKLRIDLQKRLSDRVLFEGNVDFITFHGRTTYNALDLVPFSYEPDPQGRFDFRFNDTIFVDNAFVQITLDWADIKIYSTRLMNSRDIMRCGLIFLLV